MADVRALSSSDTGELDYYLGYLESRFIELDENAGSWNELSSEDKNDFLSEWSIVEDRIRILSSLVERHGIPRDYRERYENLRRRIAQAQPLLATLWTW